MKGIQNFIKNHKKGVIVGSIIFLIIIITLFTIFFIIPSFGSNNYGNRLDGIEDHKISNSTIDKIKDNIEEKEGVTKVTYHNEGRILNFTIKVDGNTKPETAKEYATEIIKDIKEKDLKYYDVQIFLDSDDNTNDYPTAGYKHKTSDDIIWGNVGGSSE